MTRHDNDCSILFHHDYLILIYPRLIHNLYYVFLDCDCSILFISNLKRLFLKFGLIGLFVLIDRKIEKIVNREDL